MTVVTEWQPSATLETLQARAAFMAAIRSFFNAQGYLEVETPMMGAFGVTDVYLESIPTTCSGRQHFLQTSPEYHMKRLLAAGSGPIFQLARVFRDDEVGRWHNPEFTMLEWYRPGMHYHEMLKEIDALFQALLNTKPLVIKTYQEVFEAFCGINPLTASVDVLKALLQAHDLADVLSPNERDIDQYLFLLMSHVIEPLLALDEAPVAMIDFPATQAALASVRGEVAERFEVYYKGIELVNGFHELTDAKAQARRFQLDNKKRIEIGKTPCEIDTRFLAALKAGLPKATGVALGVDRLFALSQGEKQISNCIAFDGARA